MTMMDVIEMLRDMGMEVSYTKRKDGGVRVNRIGNQRFTGSKGNAIAREMTGAVLSERRVAQLKTIRTPKGSWGHRKRVEKLEDETIKRIRRVQRQMRKQGTKRTGIVTQRNYRYVLKHYGKEEAERRLAQAERYATGLAYVENVDALVKRLELDNKKLKDSALTNAIELIKSKRESMKETQLSDIIDASYDMEKIAYQSKTATSIFYNKVKQILGS